MDATDAGQALLSYAAPLRPNDVDVRRVDDGVEVLVGPMPAWVFVTALVPHAFLLATVVGLLGWTFYADRRTFPQSALILGLAVGLSVLSAVINAAILLRHRLIPRSVGATPAGIYFSDARTGGKPRRLPTNDVSAIGTRRRWWCPWVLELVAVPKYRFVTLRRETTAPIVLLAGLDRPTLQRIAGDLRQVIGSRAGGGGV